MSERLLVTGGTGLAGSAAALAAVGRFDHVRALVRVVEGTEPLTTGGVEVVRGDVTEPASLVAAMQGVTAVVHTAAVLGGTWSTTTPEQMWSVNYAGTLAVLDAAARAGVRRVVVTDTQAILDPVRTHTERAPLIQVGPSDSAYVRSKLAAYHAAMVRVAQGQDIVFLTPGPIYGPGVFVDRVLDPTSFTRVLLNALRGELASYVSFPMPWTYAPDLAELCLRAVDRGVAGRRYLAMGSDSDVSSLAGFCNQGASIAGVAHRVLDIDPNDPDGPDIGTMRQFAGRVFATPLVDAHVTNAALGFEPTPRDAGLRATIAWLSDVGELPLPAGARG